MEEVYKTPFLRLLIPLIAGILLQYYFFITFIISITLTIIGIVFMLISFLLTADKAYCFRWLFGCGAYFVLFSFGLFATRIQQQSNVFPFSEANYQYQATLIDIPLEKTNSIQLKLNLDEYDRHVIAYIPKDSLFELLSVGSKMTFMGHIQPFAPIGSVNTFNYNRYMYNQGYAGVVFIDPDYCEVSENTSFSIKIAALKCKQLILQFYKSLDLNDKELALLSGITIGYKSDFPEDLLQSFRATGTAHILAVSGLHVGIVYFLLNFLFAPIRSAKFKIPLLLLLLWLYVFVVGLPASAIRAAIMLTLYSIGCAFGYRSYNINSIFAAAFFILIFSPFSLFDLGFQFSFMAVLSICLFMPLLMAKFKSRNALSRFIYNTFTISLAAQIGILPISIYYFGSLPVYFLFANVLIVPLLTLFFYDVLLLILLASVGKIVGVANLAYMPTLIFKRSAGWIIQVVEFFENLPYATIQNIRISLLSVFCISFLLFFSWLYIKTKSAKSVQGMLLCIFVLLLSYLYNRYEQRNTITFINDFNRSQINYQLGYDRHSIDHDETNKILLSKRNIIYLLRENVWKNKKRSDSKKQIDYLMIDTTDDLSITALNDIFDIKKIIFGNAIPRKRVKRLILECEKLRIPYYDLHVNGNLTLNF